MNNCFLEARERPSDGALPLTEGIMLRLVTVLFLLGSLLVGTVRADSVAIIGVHGEVVTSLTVDSVNITVSAFNNRLSGAGAVVIFDTTQINTSDFDLEDPWSTGNIPTDTILGNILIIQENQSPLSGGTIVSDPDDEGRGGKLIFDFDTSVASFGFDLIDIDDGTEESGSIKLFFSDATSTEISFMDLAGLGSDPVFGDNSANSFAPLSFDKSISKVELNLIHSGGVTNLNVTTVPEPSTLTLLTAGLLVGAAFRKRFK